MGAMEHERIVVKSKDIGSCKNSPCDKRGEIGRAKKDYQYSSKATWYGPECSHKLQHQLVYNRHKSTTRLHSHRQFHRKTATTIQTI